MESKFELTPASKSLFYHSYLDDNETPEDLFLRVSKKLSGNGNEEELYKRLINKELIFATPMLMNIDRDVTEFSRNQLSSCFLIEPGSLDSASDKIKFINNILSISNSIGGIGISLSKVPDIFVYLRLLENLVEMGPVTRKTGIAVYLEPWHPDIFKFIEAKNPHNNSISSARNLFYALWIPDLFMERVYADKEWTLVYDPKLNELHGNEFKEYYLELEKTNNTKVRARDIWEKILNSEFLTGGPYILFKDTCNKYNSEDPKYGTVHCSNLCSEIIERTSNNHIGVCILASISLPSCVKDKTFSFSKLEEIVRLIVRSLAVAIDITTMPNDFAKNGLRSRSIGIGVQGFADMLYKLDLSFESDMTTELNKQIFEHIYYFACSESIEEAKRRNFKEIPKTKFHHQMMGTEGSLDWKSLEGKPRWFSQLVALMPTSSTSILLDNYEAFDPPISNIFSKKNKTGSFTIINKHLVQDLKSCDLWNDKIKEKIILEGGSLTNLGIVPKQIRNKYKTAFEINPERLLQLAIDRQPWVDQSQSFNIYLSKNTGNLLTKLLFKAWQGGMKTGSYYTYTRPASEPNQQCTMCTS